MEITTIPLIGTVILVLICLFLILSPFFKFSFTNSFFQQDGSESYNEKSGLMSTINEIEFEYQMKKISEEDYLSLTKKYETMIAKLMKEEEKINEEVDLKLLKEVEAEIEQEIKNRKAKQGGTKV
jgi:hypothetical protein